jgi:hypothetical protein
MKMYVMLNRVSSDWFLGPYSDEKNLFFSIRTGYDFDKGIYYRLIEAEIAIEEGDFFYPESWLSFTISHLGTTAVVRKGDEILSGGIIPLLIDWDKLKENDETTDEI